MFPTRREFLKLGALAAAALVGPSLDALAIGQEKIERKGAAKRIIVVGAGLAGLSAAHELARAGHEVTILEARMRAGGRVYTIREPFSDGMYAEAGAARIPSTHNLTLSYARQFNLPLVSFYPQTLANLNYVRGQRIKVSPIAPPDLAEAPFDLTAEERKLGLNGMSEKYVGAVFRELGDPSAADWPPPSLKKYDISLSDFMRARGASNGAIALFSLGYANPETDVDPSALWNLREEWLDQKSTRLYKIKGGSDLLPKAFAARLAEKIHYNSPVVRIEQDTQSVRVTFLHAGTPQTLTADRVLCAVPFTVIKRIEVAPAFSTEKQRAIDELHYDTVTRVYLQARKRFWTSDGLNGFALTDLPEEIWQPTHNEAGTRGILMSYLRGHMAERVGAMKEDERINFMLDHFEKIFPGMRENYEGGASWSWAADEWARGAYTLMTPGQVTALTPHIARPEGHIHFAGEHASAWQSWMQGALQSGLRAAKEMNDG